jgi:hypothetical protein
MTDETRPPGSWLDLAQSCLRLSWALSLLGASEAVNLVTGRTRTARAGAGLEAVRNAACEQMSDATREMYRAGDQIQRGVADTFADLARQPLLDPRRLARTALDAGHRFARWAEAPPAGAPRTADPAAAGRGEDGA